MFMGFSLSNSGSWNSKVSRTGTETNAMDGSVRPALARALHSRILYLGAFLVPLAVIGLLAAGVVAQESRPQITPGERKVGRKEIGPRAIAVLRLDAKGKTALVPIAIMVDGKFWDASAYKADPVPMALDSGTVYEVEKTGSSQGLFTVNGALHSTSPNMPDPWIGTGLWVPAGSSAPKTGMKAESVPVGLDTSEGPPRLTRGASAPKDAAPSGPAPAGAPSAGSSSAPPSTTPSSSPSGQAETPAASTSGSGQSSPGSTAGSTSGGSASPASSTGPASTGTASSAPTSTTPPESKPADAKPSETKAADTKPAAANVPPSDSGAGGGDRPRLRRGKPVDPLPDDDMPGYSKPGAAPAAAAKAGTPAGSAPATATGPPAQLIPAISDTTGPEPRSYAYDWLQGEESDRLKQMTALAHEQLRAYLNARAKAKIGTPATGSQAGRRKAAGKPPDAVFENVHMTPYDLWTNGQPVLVFSAEAHLPPTGWTQERVDADLRYSILLVAHPDLYNNLIKLYVGITDKYHLDITPRLDLIDVLDADGDGRGELLFRETTDAGGGYAIYRVTADKLWKMFDSLNPE